MLSAPATPARTAQTKELLFGPAQPHSLLNRPLISVKA